MIDTSLSTETPRQMRFKKTKEDENGCHKLQSIFNLSLSEGHVQNANPRENSWCWRIGSPMGPEQKNIDYYRGHNVISESSMPEPRFEVTAC